MTLKKRKITDWEKYFAVRLYLLKCRLHKDLKNPDKFK